MEQAIVVTADIVDSRKGGFKRDKFEAVLRSLPFATILLPFAFSRGDEIQALVGSSLALPRLLRTVRFSLRPFDLRLGVARGNVESFSGKESSWEMDGEAFHRARENLDLLKRSPERKTCISGWDTLRDASANTIFLLLDTLQSEWTERQWEAVHAYEEAGTYRKAAKTMGIRLQNVQKHCQRAHWDVVQTAEGQLQELLSADSPEKGGKSKSNP